MHFTCKEKIEQEVSAKERSVQDKTMEEISKMQVIWYQKGLLRCNHWEKFKIVRSYYWWCGNDDPHTFQPTWIIQKNIENIEDKVYDDIDVLSIKNNWYNISAKHDRINMWSNKTEDKEL